MVKEESKSRKTKRRRTTNQKTSRSVGIRSSKVKLSSGKRQGGQSSSTKVKGRCLAPSPSSPIVIPQLCTLAPPPSDFQLFNDPPTDITMYKQIQI